MKTFLTTLTLCLAAALQVHPAPTTVKRITAPINPATGLPSVTNFGSSVALSNKWMAFGSSNDLGNKGSVHLYNAATGAFVRKLVASDGVSGDMLGGLVAISGDNIIAAASSASVNGTANAGKLYVFNAVTGKEVRQMNAVAGDPLPGSIVLGANCLDAEGDYVVAGTRNYDNGRGKAWIFRLSTGEMVAALTAPDGVNSDNFASAADISGSLVAVGAYNRRNTENGDTNQGNGAVYIFNAETGAHLTTIVPPIFQANARGGFGYSLALEGTRLLVGSPFMNNSQGYAQVMDVRNSDLLCVFEELFFSDGDTYGLTVKMQGGLAVISASNAESGKGRVFLHHAITGDLIEEVEMRETQSGDFLGSVMAFSGTNLLLGKYGNNQPSLQSVLWLQNVPAPLPGRIVVSTGDYAPGLFGASFSGFASAIANAGGYASFIANIRPGAGTPAGATKGLWSAGDYQVNLILRNGAQMGGAPKITDFSLPQMNTYSRGVLKATLSGTGITPLNRQRIVGFEGGGPYVLGTTFDSQVFGTGTQIANFNYLGQSYNETYSEVAVLCGLKVGAGGVTMGKDTGILMTTSQSATAGSIAREGDGNGIDLLGQINRVTYNFNLALYHAALPGASPNQGLYAYNRMTGTTALVMRQNDPINIGIGTIYLDSVISETTGGITDAFAMRCTTKAALGSTTSTESILTNLGGSFFFPHVVKGASTGFLPQANIVVDKLLGYWVEGNSLLYLCTVKGPGVTAANDTCLVVSYFGVSGFPNSYLLMREGSAAPGCRGARIGVIQRVDAEPMSGQYAVLASLTGAPAGQDQALFNGCFDKTNFFAPSAPEGRLRVPTPLIIKGSLIDIGLAGPVKVTSITISAPGMDAGGAGGRTPRSVGSDDGDVVAIIGLSDGTKRVVELSFPTAGI